MYTPETKELRFNPDGKFRILMISDLHARGRKIPDEKGRLYSQKMVDAIEALVEETKPDFVMLGGDQCIGYDEAYMRMALSDILEPLHKRGIPWAHVHGNHDNEERMTTAEQEPIYESYPLCLSQAGPEDIFGIGNYVLPVYASSSNRIAYNIFALDSHRDITDYIKEFNIPDRENNILMPVSFGSGENQASPFFDQVMWYYDTSEEMEEKNGAKIPAVMFLHVPILEANLIGRNPDETNMIGHKRCSVGCSELDSGLFFACLERGDVKGIFWGHEHMATFQGTYCGITMGTDGCIGFDMSGHDDLRGGRILDLDEATGTFETRFLPLTEIMGRNAWKNPDNFEGGWNTDYFIRKPKSR